MQTPALLYRSKIADKLKSTRLHLFTVHLMGTCRIGLHPENSVVGVDHRVHGLQNHKYFATDFYRCATAAAVPGQYIDFAAEQKFGRRDFEPGIVFCGGRDGILKQKQREEYSCSANPQASDRNMPLFSYNSAWPDGDALRPPQGEILPVMFIKVLLRRGIKGNAD